MCGGISRAHGTARPQATLQLQLARAKSLCIHDVLPFERSDLRILRLQLRVALDQLALLHADDLFVISHDITVVLEERLLLVELVALLLEDGRELRHA